MKAKKFIFSLLVIGVSGIIAQVLLLREFLVGFAGNELSLGIILANWLILESFGALFIGRRIEKIQKRLEVFLGTIIVFALALPAALYFIYNLGYLTGGLPGEGVGIITILWSSFLIFLPVSLSHGALFTFGCKIYSQNFRPGAPHFSKKHSESPASSIGRVYVYEALGTIFGGLIFTFYLIPRFSSISIALGLSLLNIFVAFSLSGSFWGRARLFSSRFISFISLILILIGGSLLFFNFDQKIHNYLIQKRWPNQDVLYYRNSEYGNIAVTKSFDQYTFFSDGVPIITLPDSDLVFAEELAHFPALFASTPKKALVLSSGAGGLINELLKYQGLEKIDYVELDPLLIETVAQFGTGVAKRELSSQRVNIKQKDGRFHLKVFPGQYDLILIGLGEPSNLQANRLFTEEFFREASRKLSDTGVLALRLPGSLSYLSPQMSDLNSCLLNTLKQVYPYVRPIPGDPDNLYLASFSSFLAEAGPKELGQRLEDESLSGLNIINKDYIAYKLDCRRQEWFRGFLDSATTQTNRDFRPLGAFFSMAHWNAIFSPGIGSFLNFFQELNISRVFFVLVVLFLFLMIFLSFLKKPAKAALPLSIGATGLAGMLFDLILIFAFQAIYGYLFHWLGLLIAFFMAGSMLGAIWMIKNINRFKKSKDLFLILEVFLVIFALILPIFLIFLHNYAAVINPTFKIFFFFLSLLSGFLVGVQFPIANKMFLGYGGNVGDTAGLLYGSDLLGGWVGGMLGATFLLPVLGLLNTCLVIAGIKVITLILLFFSLGKS